jgi:hypothetical protein
MTESVHATPSDALVFFGITGDLAFKQIFPALQALIRRTRLDVPIIGIARSASSHEQLCSRAHASLEAHGGVDAEAFGKLCARLRYIAGDYGDAATYERLRAALGAARRPLHYLAIPPSLFVTVVDGLARSGCAQRDRPREGVGRKRFADRHVGQVAAHRSYGKALQIEARIGSVGDRRDPGTMSAQGQIVVPCWVRLTPQPDSDPADGLVQGRNLQDIAKTQRISVETIRSQLKSIYSKTDTHRQAQLIELLLRTTAFRHTLVNLIA